MDPSLEPEGLKYQLIKISKLVQVLLSKKMKSNLGIGDKGHVPILGRYDLAETVFLGFVADGGDISHGVTELLGRRVVGRAFLETKQSR